MPASQNPADTPDLPATFHLELVLNKAKGARTTIAPQQPFLLLFALSSLPCVSKAASSAPKIIQKFQAEGCFAVFSGLHFSRQRKTRRQYWVYYQGFFCRIGKCSHLKTCWGSSSLCLRRFYIVQYVSVGSPALLGKGFAKSLRSFQPFRLLHVKIMLCHINICVTHNILDGLDVHTQCLHL